MAEFQELKVAMTLSMDELRELVGLLNYAGDKLEELGLPVPAVVGEISTMYFQLEEQLEETDFADFKPE
jgi:hypothetical protein